MSIRLRDMCVGLAALGPAAALPLSAMAQEYPRLNLRFALYISNSIPQAKNFQRWADEDAGESFVIHSSGTKRGPRAYRCETVFDSLVAWLRGQGVKSQKPIHELRKECGSLICERAGIAAASAFLRDLKIGLSSRIGSDSFLQQR